MRASIYKCPNHLGCTTGYHGDDIEIADGAPAVCPECGKPLQPVRNPSNKLGAYLVNALTVALFAFALWYSWPQLVKLWHRYVSPGAAATQPTK